MAMPDQSSTIAPVPFRPVEAQRRPIEPGTRSWDEIGLITFSLSAGSAFLLQTMDPSIGAVVDEHSVFRTDGIGRAVRSIASVMTWIYGGEDALAEADRLREMHKTLNSVDEHGVRHTALSSGPWAWVLLTGIYTMAENANYFARRPLRAAEKEALYQEAQQLLRNFSVAEKEIPADYPALVRHIDDVIDNRLVDHKVSHEYLAASRTVPPPPALPKVLHPAWCVGAYLPGRLQHFVTVGTTPPKARAKLGLRWSAADERGLRALGWLIARTVPLLPERLRYFPIAYEARKVERARQRLRKVLDLRPR